MSTIGDRIIAEIIKQGMIDAHDVDGPIATPVIFVWHANSAEQLEAVVDTWLQDVKNEIANELRKLPP